MNVLITGGTGSIGSRLAIPLVRRGDTVVAFDVRSEPHFDSDEFRHVNMVVSDLGDGRSLVEAVRSYRIDSIFHLGAVLSANAEESPRDAWRANMDGTANVLEAARQSSAKRVIFSSTLATYGAGVPDPLVEDAPQWPVSLYGVTKVAGERLGAYYHHRFGVDFRGIRFPAVIAPRGSGGGASAYVSAVFEQSVLKGEYDFYVNRTTRAPMMYIADAVRALLELHDAPAGNLRRSVYNLGGITPSAEELATSIKSRLPEVRITYTPDPVRTAIVESWPCQIDDSAARQDWNWTATWDLERITSNIVEVLRHDFANQ